MKRQKTQKGITLIALIITIIVLLILAVVAIGAVQNDGIIEYAKNARDQYRLAQDEESSILGNYLSMLNKNNGNGAGGNENGTEAMSYHIGDIVTVAGEMFYVLKDCPETQNNVVLLAKDNIIIDGANSVQSATNASTTGFSETNYWENEFTSNPYDLIETGKPANNHYAALAAYNYGEKLEGTGRLMTYNEANALVGTQYRRMILGNEENMFYWLGTASDGGTICNVSYGGVGSYDGWGNYGWEIGVRPVVEISKDKVAFVSENAYAGCATCNSTGYVTRYSCSECGESNAAIESEVVYYWAQCDLNMIGCGKINTSTTGIPDTCECGMQAGVNHFGTVYNITYKTCNHTVETDYVPQPFSTNCPDCDIAYVYEDPEGGK